MTALDPYFILHDGEANVYGFRSAGINCIVSVSARAFEDDVIVRQELG